MRNFPQKKLQDYASGETGGVLKELRSGKSGLSHAEASRRIMEFGKNILVEEAKHFWLMDFFNEFRNPLIITLIIAATISAFFKETVNAVIIFVMVIVSTLLNFFQEYKANKAAHDLKARLNTIVTVIREGTKKDVDIKYICVGDLVYLNAGDLIPADARVIESKDFFVNQSSLTGESFPCEKTDRPIKGDISGLDKLNNIVFSGTNVVTGTATVVVLKTGKETEFGKIANTLNQREEISEFSTGINRFSNMIMKTTIFIVLMIFMINALMKKDVLESFLFAIAIAVGLTPELLPMILSINMSSGSINMAKKGVIVKKLVAIPNFGSMDVLCTDKTGTLTEDRIVVVKCVNGEGKESDRVLLHAYLNSRYQTGITNPMDKALLNFRKVDISGYRKIDEIPFDFLRKRMSVVVQKGKDRLLICKGAPEEVMEKSVRILDGPFSGAVTPAKKKVMMKTYENLSKDGYRVLAISIRKLPDGVKGGTKIYEPADERDLTFLGFIAFLDPAKTDVKKVIDEIELSGIEIKIITGDNELVTKKICDELEVNIKGIMLGHEIDGMTDDALEVAVEKVTIFARFSPDEKNRIIRALKQNGHVVGYMGDGINDAPSLKTADIGISVENAVDVARESADMILTQKSLRVLLDGILEGRKTFGNSMKYIMMGVSSNFGNMFSVIGAVLFLPFLPMLPIQILLNNLLYDFSQITIPGDKVDEEYIRSPKRWNMPFIKKFMITFGLMSSLFDIITYLTLFFVLKLPESGFQTGWFMESLATQTLIIHVIRTRLIPFKQSTASTGLLASTISVVAIGWILPFTPLGTLFGMSPLPPLGIFLLIIIVIVYLLLVEAGKRIFYRRYSF